jgi:hypothetical protein
VKPPDREATAGGVVFRLEVLFDRRRFSPSPAGRCRLIRAAEKETLKGVGSDSPAWPGTPDEQHVNGREISGSDQTQDGVLPHL